MANRKLRNGVAYEIEFLDHCEDGDDAVTVTVYGRVVGSTKHCYQVHSWITEDAPESCNQKRWAILKSAITHATPQATAADRKGKDARRK